MKLARMYEQQKEERLLELAFELQDEPAADVEAGRPQSFGGTEQGS